MTLKPFTIALFVGLVGWWMVACSPPSVDPPADTGPVRNITATEFKFSPGDQTFKSGEKYTINLTNQGAVDHTWVLTDSSGAELVKLEVKVGKKSSIEFTAPAPGAYAIICDVAGHTEAGMKAKATVQ